MLDTAGLEVIQLPNTFENPLDRVIQELKQADGALIICFERLYAKEAIEFRNSEAPGPEVRPLQAPTIWNHVESALAKAADVPVLVLAENGCRADGMLDPKVQFKIHWMEFDDRLLSETYFRQLFHSWIDAIADRGKAPRASAIEKVSDLRFSDILRSLRVGEIVGILTAAGSLFAAGIWVGSHIQNLPN